MKKELFDIYVAATKLARREGQIEEKEQGDFYITLQQLQTLIENTL